MLRLRKRRSAFVFFWTCERISDTVGRGDCVLAFGFKRSQLLVQQVNLREVQGLHGLCEKKLVAHIHCRHEMIVRTPENSTAHLPLPAIILRCVEIIVVDSGGLPHLVLFFLLL